MKNAQGEFLKYAPGSKEARDAGCNCPVEQNKDKYMVNEHCPLHWHIVMVSKTMEMHHYIKQQDKDHMSLKLGLIIAVFVVFLYFLFGVN